MTAGLIFALVCALLAIAYGVFQSGRILRLPEGNERMREISLAIREGAVAYLWRQYKTIAIVGVILFLVIGFVPMIMIMIFRKRRQLRPEILEAS